MNWSLQSQTMAEKQHDWRCCFHQSQPRTSVSHGMYHVMESNKLKHIVGSLYECIGNIASTAKFTPKALGYVCLFIKNATIPEGAMIGEILKEEHLVNTSYHGQGQHTDLVLNYLNILFFFPMIWEHVKVSITDNDIITKFANLAPNKDPEDLIHSIAKAKNESAAIGEIFTNISGSEKLAGRRRSLT